MYGSGRIRCIAKRYVSPLLKAVVGELERAAVLGDRTYNMLWRSLGQLGVDLHRDLDPGAEQTAQVLRNLLDHGSGIAYSTCRVKRDGAVEALRLWLCGCDRSV